MSINMLVEKGINKHVELNGRFDGNLGTRSESLKELKDHLKFLTE